MPACGAVVVVDGEADVVEFADFNGYVARGAWIEFAGEFDNPSAVFQFAGEVCAAAAFHHAVGKHIAIFGCVAARFEAQQVHVMSGIQFSLNRGGIFAAIETAAFIEDAALSAFSVFFTQSPSKT